VSKERKLYRKRILDEKKESTENAIRALNSKIHIYGLTLPESSHAMIRSLITRRGPKRQIRIPASVLLKDGKVIDPAIIVNQEEFDFHELNQSQSGAPASVYAGGEVTSVGPSSFALPKPLQQIASCMPEHGLEYGLMLVSVAGDKRYLVRKDSEFFHFKSQRGSEVDSNWWGKPDEAIVYLSYDEEPEEVEHLIAGTYDLVDNMNENLSIIVADLSDIELS